jgi:RNA ligase (TIGR02306 family)
MSTFKVTIEKIEVLPHPNADKLELAQVGLNRAVVGKGQFETGDWAIYIPEAAVLPPELIEELGLTGRLAGRDKNRVKAVRLRGEVSQGIVCRPAVVNDLLGGKWDDIPMSVSAGMAEPVDFADVLGITKYVPEIPTQMAGKVYAADRLLRWPDIESIKRHPDIFEPGEPVSVTEKIHGTCFLLTFVASDTEDYVVAVSSKGYGGKGLAIERDAGNLYWRVVDDYYLEIFANQVSLVAGAPVVGLFGEVYGIGVQDLTYDADAKQGAPGFALFDIAVDYGDGVQVFLSPEEFQNTVKTVNSQLVYEGVYLPGVDHMVKIAPVLYQGPYDEKTLLELAEGKTTLGGGNIREGVVVRPRKEAHSAVTGSRKIGKIVGEGYLTRGGNATEFE